MMSESQTKRTGEELGERQDGNTLGGLTRKAAVQFSPIRKR